MEQITIAALYKFVTLDDYQAIQPKLLEFCKQHNILGTLLLAEEGINGTIAGLDNDIKAVLKYLQSDQRLADLPVKFSYAKKRPFLRMKVKLKKEIVTCGDETINPTDLTGDYVDYNDWNKLISDPNTIVLDTRNDYEYNIGTFENAKLLDMVNFRDFGALVKKELCEEDKDKNIAMFCTGGIRCEKASAVMLKQGFKKVYQLEGGILKYLENIEKAESKWQGDCFVFDNRVSVDHNLQSGNYTQCFGCRYPLSQEDLTSEYYVKGVSCPNCYTKSDSKKERARERAKQIELAKQRGEEHIG